MNCPHCDNKISSLHIRRKFACKSCGKDVYFQNVDSRVVVWFLIWLFVITPISLLLFEFPKGFVVDAILALLLLFVITQYGIKLKKQPD